MVIPRLVTRFVCDHRAFMQILQNEMAKVDTSSFRFYMKATVMSAGLTLGCGIGFLVTEQPGKKRTLANKAFLAAGLIGAAATTVCEVTAVVSGYFAFKPININSFLQNAST